MMKRNCLLIILLTLTLSVLAIPAKRGNRIVQLADGTGVELRLCGDEYGHWWQSADGQRYQLDDNGIASKMTDLRFEAVKVSSIARRNAANEVRAQRMAKARKAWGNTTFTGQKKGLVIMVNFSDKKMLENSTQEEFNDMFNLEGYSKNNHIGSVHDYFYDQSYGMLDLDFDVVGPVTVSNNMSYYGSNDSYGNDKHPAEMVIEACRLADENYNINFADYDWNGNGQVDQVFVICAGYGEHAGAPANTIWPHEYELSSAAHYGDGEGAITLDGVEIDTYAVSCELANSSGSTWSGIGTACHEFSHCLGYPDLYDTDYSGGWGMEAWDIMDLGSYNGPDRNGEVPSGYTSYERWVAGWLEPKVLNPYMVVDSLRPLVDEPDAYVMYNDANSNEYYLFENRTPDRWFKYVLGHTDISGMLVIHVDYDKKIWNNNTPNDDPSRQRMTVIPASDNFTSYGSRSDYQNQLYPYGSRNSLTNTTKPKASLNNKNTDGTKLMNKPIYNITKHDDNIISFVCGDETPDEPDTPETPEGDCVFYESFNQCAGAGGNDDLWGGTIAVSAFVPDNQGWVCDKAFGANECAKFGTSSVNGTTTTPSFVLNGDGILTFNAACWNTDSGTLTILVNDQEVETLTMEQKTWTAYTVDIKGQGLTTVTFKVSKRFFLDEVKVVKTDAADGIREVRTVEDDAYYNLNGMRVDASYNGIIIKNGKKYLHKNH